MCVCTRACMTALCRARQPILMCVYMCVSRVVLGGGGTKRDPPIKKRLPNKCQYNTQHSRILSLESNPKTKLPFARRPGIQSTNLVGSRL